MLDPQHTLNNPLSRPSRAHHLHHHLRGTGADGLRLPVTVSPWSLSDLRRRFRAYSFWQGDTLPSRFQASDSRSRARGDSGEPLVCTTVQAVLVSAQVAINRAVAERRPSLLLEVATCTGKTFTMVSPAGRLFVRKRGMHPAAEQPSLDAVRSGHADPHRVPAVQIDPDDPKCRTAHSLIIPSCGMRDVRPTLEPTPSTRNSCSGAKI